ncbi:heme-binding protein [Leeia aquatica]|uniref:DUF1794 domain-containing protein n=1 Tax=Leeia aquatica TaxID=2725557 RepID=A0A847RX96_9NEIS|nr:heme-binding protein [Leeia aquatica]NLR75780.1 hypothetical protein [Leeia aquatica]
MATTLRASAPTNPAADPLGLLAELAGTWIGNGFNLIALPNKAGNSIFRLKINATKESLVFTPVGAPIPNRGSLQGDIEMGCLTYFQRVNDASSNELLHLEPGLWLNVPSTTAPAEPPTVVRQATIPHGDSMLVVGNALSHAGPPQIQPVSTTPTGPTPFPLGYLDPYQTAPVPPGFQVSNPNASLVDAIKEQNIVSTTTLSLSSTQQGGVVNIPFIVSNANANRVDTIFWIETVEQPDGKRFMQLQYTQTVILHFAGIDWPHVSVGTLLKQ